jgi:hypothetical protein
MASYRLLIAALLLAGSARAQVIFLHAGTRSIVEPVNNGGAAALATATQNSACTTIQPFYIEIDAINGSSTWSTSSPVGGSVSTGTAMSVASGSKIQYGAYVVAFKGGAANLTTADKLAGSFSDGYSNMGSETAGTQCVGPSGLTPFSANISSSTTPTVWTGTGFKIQNNQAITLSGSPPTPFNTTTTYYVTGATTSTTFSLSTTAGGSGSAITATASGSANVTIQPNFSVGTSIGGTVDSPNYCLPQAGVNNTAQTNAYQFSSQSTNKQFAYDGGHAQNNASANFSGAGQFANLPSGSGSGTMYSLYAAQFSNGGSFTQPMVAGGVYQTPTNYLAFLKALTNSTNMMSVFTTTYIAANGVCAWTTPKDSTGNLNGYCPTAYFSPITSDWSYVFHYWLEGNFFGSPSGPDYGQCLPDCSANSVGAFGAYPFITPQCPAAGHAGNLCQTTTEFNAAGPSPWTYYGGVFRQVAPGTSPTGNGQASAACGALVRKAYFTGIQQ